MVSIKRKNRHKKGSVTRGRRWRGGDAAAKRSFFTHYEAPDLAETHPEFYDTRDWVGEDTTVKDPCTDYRVDERTGQIDCTGCAPGYVPMGPVGRRECKPAQGSTVELRDKLPHCRTAHTDDGKYGKGDHREGKKYDCTTCDDGYFPVGPPGERRCLPTYVPIDPNNRVGCTSFVGDDCVVCKAGMVPAGPRFHRRCVLAGQMWNREEDYYNQNVQFDPFPRKPKRMTMRVPMRVPMRAPVTGPAAPAPNAREIPTVDGAIPEMPVESASTEESSSEDTERRPFPRSFSSRLGEEGRTERGMSPPPERPAMHQTPEDVVRGILSTIQTERKKWENFPRTTLPKPVQKAKKEEMSRYISSVQRIVVGYKDQLSQEGKQAMKKELDAYRRAVLAVLTPPPSSSNTHRSTRRATK